MRLLRSLLVRCDVAIETDVIFELPAALGFPTPEGMQDHYQSDIAHRDSVLGGIVFPTVITNKSNTLNETIHFEVRIPSAY